jgi:hypothetical protein
MEIVAASPTLYTETSETDSGDEVTGADVVAEGISVSTAGFVFACEQTFPLSDEDVTSDVGTSVIAGASVTTSVVGS